MGKLTNCVLALALAGTAAYGWAGGGNGAVDGGGGQVIVTPDGQVEPFDLFHAKVRELCPAPIPFEPQADPAIKDGMALAKSKIEHLSTIFPAFGSRLLGTLSSIRWNWCQTMLPLILDFGVEGFTRTSAGAVVLPGELKQAAILTGNDDEVILQQGIFLGLQGQPEKQAVTLIHEILKAYLGNGIDRKILYQATAIIQDQTPETLRALPQILDSVDKNILQGNISLYLFVNPDRILSPAETRDEYAGARNIQSHLCMRHGDSTEDLSWPWKILKRPSSGKYSIDAPGVTLFNPRNFKSDETGSLTIDRVQTDYGDRHRITEGSLFGLVRHTRKPATLAYSLYQNSILKRTAVVTEIQDGDWYVLPDVSFQILVP
jgi:hypothetical protein